MAIVCPPPAPAYLDAIAHIAHRAVRQDIMTRPDLTPSARAVFVFFWRCLHQPHPLQRLFFAEKTIAQETYLTPRSVRRALRVLEAAGLLTTVHRLRRGAVNDHDWTTNEYRLHWTPFRTSDPAASRPSEPPLSGGLRTDSPEGVPAETPEYHAPQGVQDSAPTAIQDPGATQYDQHAPESAPTGGDPPDPLLSLVNSWGISQRTLAAWIRTFGVARVQEVVQWARSAPPGTICNPGAWIRTALREGWAPPTWVRAAQAKAERAARGREALRAAREHQAQEDAAQKARRDADDALWARLEPRLAHLSELVAAAAAQARATLGPAFAALWRPGSGLWRMAILATARAHPELWQSETECAI